jgi:hypothetical protein
MAQRIGTAVRRPRSPPPLEGEGAAHEVGEPGGGCPERVGARRAMTAAIREAASPEDVALARALFVEYAQWLAVDLCFQGFDRELATLPGA